ncbi:MAG: hypothetical protein HZY76_00770 [Anaerolineae bacterium]|nr:MAG: hypothetical protein HZY76_00770 [Anaerolineae bacterium]
MKPKAFPLLLAALCAVIVMLPAAAALAGPAPGVVYDPACDVDQDGDVDIFDIRSPPATGTRAASGRATTTTITWARPGPAPTIH